MRFDTIVTLGSLVQVWDIRRHPTGARSWMVKKFVRL